MDQFQEYLLFQAYGKRLIEAQTLIEGCSAKFNSDV